MSSLKQVFDETVGPAHAVFVMDFPALGETRHYGCLFHSTGRKCARDNNLPGFWRAKGGAE